MREVDLVVVGGGPAGMAAALGAFRAGVKDIEILEREDKSGGILNQCVHNGFGLHTFREELTGPEYAARYRHKLEENGISVKTGTTVLDVTPDREVTAVNEREGVFRRKAKAVILACGCRERPRGAIRIAGTRPAGVYTAGTAQKMVNVMGLMPGREVVVLGSGDIGLIMARRMTFEGAKVKAVLELMPYSSGLRRNIVQCLDDFGIPLRYSHTVVRIHGRDRVEGVTAARVDENLNPLPETFEYIPCDALLLSVGLLPENELASRASVTLSPVTGGAEVDERMMTEREGIFACGNVLHVHDLVDYVSRESEDAGRAAAEYIRGGKSSVGSVPLRAEGAVRYVVPQRLTADGKGGVSLKMRVSGVYKKTAIEVRCGEKVVARKARAVVSPGEMETLELTAAQAAEIRAAGGAAVGLEGIK